MQEHSLRQVSISAVGLLLAITAAAQTSYRVTDLGALHDGVFGCAMGLNNRGWTESSSPDLSTPARSTQIVICRAHR